MQANPLVITGTGAVTPLGLDCDSFWKALCAGACGVGPITRFDASALPVRIAAEVKGFRLEEGAGASLLRNLAPFAQFGFAAGVQALREAGLERPEDPERVGVVIGTALDGMAHLAQTQDLLSRGAMRKVGPRLVPMVIGNMPACVLAMAHGLLGPSLTGNPACSSGGDAVLTAAMLLRSGDADCVLVVGAETIISPIIISSLAAAKALSRRNGEPSRASRPFDRERDGFVMGEGGGALVLETAEHAARRGARALAVLAGWANNPAAYHVPSPDPAGAGAARCMRLALERAGMEPGDVGYLNAHGTSTPAGDRAEAMAIRSVFGEGEAAPLVSSTKGATGHMMAAGGITELIACIRVLQTGLVHPPINHESDARDCPLRLVADAPARAHVRAAMSNSLGFGGQNSSVILAR